MIEQVIWKDVVGYEGIYEVSNNGDIRTKEGKTTYTKRHGVRVWKQRVLSQKIDSQNSCRVNLWRDGSYKTYLVHRLVAEAFIPKVESKEFINHKDGSRLNNHVDNLEWCDYVENNNHAFDNGLMSTNHSIKLIKIDSGEEIVFRSKSKASEFLGRNSKYISTLLRRGKTEVDGYKIIE
ncbi:HNH endonuclease [Bacillus phage PBC2]|uniref:HNH endonuclease n=1 Tax=Bacillus phage PBC2 TaxID=1675029 RepID=A0A218KBW3_9CAUD|nr:HNH endonuclease [Bacillus phage PBC2]AKQ08395.1 HNH endonuclease [Bacillus phage PBC2]